MFSVQNFQSCNFRDFPIHSAMEDSLAKKYSSIVRYSVPIFSHGVFHSVLVTGRPVTFYAQKIFFLINNVCARNCLRQSLHMKNLTMIRIFSYGTKKRMNPIKIFYVQVSVGHLLFFLSYSYHFTETRVNMEMNPRGEKKYTLFSNKTRKFFLHPYTMQY